MATSITKENNKVSESFGKIGKDISIKKLTFNNSYFESQKSLGDFYNFKDQTKINFRYFLLEKAYKLDNTNLDIIEKFVQLKEQVENYSNEKEIIEKIEEILKLNKPLINTSKEMQLNKIFDLIEQLSKFNVENIYERSDIENYFIEFLKSNQIALDFNIEITPENDKVYIYTIYYNWVTKLCKILEKFDKENNRKKWEMEYDKIKKFIEKEKDKIISKIKKVLFIEKTTEIDEEELKIKIEQERNKEKSKNYDSNTKTSKESEKQKELDNLLKDLNKNNYCLDSLYNYLNPFYTRYLKRLQYFLENIPKTKNYLKTLDYDNINNIKILRDFIFFLSYYSFADGKFQNIINYYETTFTDFDIKNNNKFQIIGEDLISPIEGMAIKNYKDYNLNCYEIMSMDENRFMYEGYIKFNLFHEKNLFNKYRAIYKEFFKELFIKENSCVKKLFIEAFPVLQDNYFINENLLEYIFDKKINVFNYANQDFVGMTITSNLDIFIKGNYNNNKDKLEVEICIFAAFIIIIIHELSDFIRIYIFKHLDIKEYEKSLCYDENEEPEIGRFVETQLFGRVIEKLNIIEALYILNIKNYFKESSQDFLLEFEKLKFVKKIDKIEDHAKKFLQKVEINKENIKLDPKSELILKGSSNCLFIGANNDKIDSREEILELYHYMDIKYKGLIKYKKNKI